AIALLATACGSSSQQKAAAPTTPPPQANASSGSVVYNDKKGGFGQDEVMPLEAESKTTPDATPAGPSDPLRPATQDLPKEKRDTLVRDSLRKGVQALRAHDADGTVRAARTALDLDESNVEAMIMLAHGYYMKGYDDKVEAVLTLAQKQKAGDNDAGPWMLFGLLHDRTNPEDLALSSFEKATKLKPDYLAALVDRGAIYLKRHRYADAVPVFEQVVQIEDKSPKAHTNLGSAYRGRSADVGDAKDHRDQL